MNTIHLPLQQPTCAFYGIDVQNVMANVFSRPMIDGVVDVVFLDATVAGVLVRHQRGARLNVLLDELFHRLAVKIRPFQREYHRHALKPRSPQLCQLCPCSPDCACLRVCCLLCRRRLFHQPRRLPLKGG